MYVRIIISWWAILGVLEFLKNLCVFCVDRATGEKDVRFKVLYTGICHSDLHHLKNDWGRSKYPLVPGYDSNSPLSTGF